jgi:thioredoxin-dependent peroxiredoxin
MQIGDLAPHFSLPDKNNQVQTLTSAKTVLFFYPKDDTPGCTIEAQEFSKLADEFKAKGVLVYGISGLDSKSKAKFAEKCSISVPLLSDADFAVCKAYGVYGEKTFMGKKFMGILRTTFIIENKKIKQVFADVKPAGHAKQVLEAI